MQILIFRNEIKYDHGLMGVGWFFLWKRRTTFWEWMARQQAAVCGRQVGGESHRKQQIINAHTDPSMHICYFRMW